MIPYLPNNENNDLGDQETWNLVGCDPMILQLHNIIGVSHMWALSFEDDEISTLLNSLLVRVERVTYNRLIAKHDKPSEKYALRFDTVPYGTGV